MQPTLSVLIPTLRSRSDKLTTQVDRLRFQSQGLPVQILWIGDNKSVSVGSKRNMLLRCATGKYVCFVDDDDKVADNYIESVLKAIDSDKPVITFLGTQSDNGIATLDFKYSIAYGRNHKPKIDGKYWKVMLPDHLCIWKKDFIKESFPDKQLGEDHAWANEMMKHYNDSDIHEINEYLYHYEYNRDLSECR
jgi:glycosyltransferase involved in cell wall biosynthesis